MSHKDSSGSEHQTPTKETADSSSNQSGTSQTECQLPFSPVAVTTPEAGHSSGRLTGLPRKIKDTCADWYNYVKEWDILNSTGMQLITEISNMKIAAGAELETESGETKDLSSVLPEKLEDFCEKLKVIYLSMEKLVLKFEHMTSCLENVAVLNQSYHDGSVSSSSSLTTSHGDILFKTWPTHMFADASRRLLKMYQKELSVKKSIMENVAHSANRDTLMAYAAVWLHQPYIEQESEALIEAMILETGLR